MSSRPLTLRDLEGLALERVRGVGSKKKEALESFGIGSVLDLLTTYPRRYVDRTNMARIADLVEGVEALVVVEVVSARAVPLRNRRSMVACTVTDGSRRLSLTFFNQPWREKQLTPGLSVAVFGKPETYRGYLQMTNPLVDPVGDRTGRIVPIYPQSEKSRISSWDLGRWIEDALDKCAPRGIADPVPTDVLKRHALVERGAAMRAIHLPESMEEQAAARRRLAFDEVLRVQLMLVARKAKWQRDSAGFAHATAGHLLDGFLGGLPFPLTGAQRRVIDEIHRDLASRTPMHRLLQGDVGAGKTVVAVATMLAAVQGGHQAALMAPTEVLADQHALSVRALLASLTLPDEGNLFGDRSLRIELLTSKVGATERRRILAGLAAGEVDIVIGTHALIQDDVAFASLGVVVVDEQHRFGVEQRAKLREKALESGEGLVPDVLVMTATPIPRTAAMTVYGDLDVSVLDEMPPGRTPIKTSRVTGPLEEAAMWAQVRERLDAGQQAYVVCPMIDENEKLEVASATETRDALTGGELDGHSVALLHGRMSSADKEAVMSAFRSGEMQVLVATTVIEVGVDVPNATGMVILDADRFGIAQLHQLRGRVGRGAIASQCWLVTSADGESPRVAALVASTDGFVLAEEDLRLRGEGTIMGVNQKGRSDLVLASLQRDLDLISAARTEAVALVGSDPMLERLADLRDELDLLFSDEDEEFLFRS
ncbi:MAG: ATP-dependent DNA helicase RecG [Ilumatobacteraceae bacterium]